MKDREQLCTLRVHTHTHIDTNRKLVQTREESYFSD